MKISEETLEAGRDLIRKKDLDGLLLWMKDHASTIDNKLIAETYGPIFKYDDVEKGLKLFNAVFPAYDSAIDNYKIITYYLLRAIIIMGVIGGVLYILSLLF